MQFTAHAYLVRGGASALPGVLELLKNGKGQMADPDLYVRAYAHFGIDEARDVRERASMRAIAGEGRVFVIATDAITEEAQNALLKTFEEPPAGALFFLLVPSPETLLATLRSRMQSLIPPGAQARADSPIEPAAFLSSPPERRIEMLKVILDAEERDVGGALAFLAALERVFAVRVKEAGVQQGAEALFRARKFITDKGALMKPLLEQVALLTPRL